MNKKHQGHINYEVLQHIIRPQEITKFHSLFLENKSLSPPGYVGVYSLLVQSYSRLCVFHRAVARARYPGLLCHSTQIFETKEHKEVTDVLYAIQSQENNFPSNPQLIKTRRQGVEKIKHSDRQ